MLNVQFDTISYDGAQYPDSLGMTTVSEPSGSELDAPVSPVGL